MDFVEALRRLPSEQRLGVWETLGRFDADLEAGHFHCWDGDEGRAVMEVVLPERLSLDKVR